MTLSREGLLGFIQSELGVDVSSIEDDTRLFSGGVVDSHMLLSIITYVERQTGVSVGAADLESFDTVGNMLAFAARRDPARGSP